MMFKEGVDPRHLSAPAWYAAHIADDLHEQYTNERAVITSTGEGRHSVKRSAHYTGEWMGYGRAFDLRVWYLNDQVDAYSDELQTLLGGDYVVLLERRSDGDPSHIHVHWAPVYRPGD